MNRFLRLVLLVAMIMMGVFAVFIASMIAVIFLGSYVGHVRA